MPSSDTFHILMGRKWKLSTGVPRKIPKTKLLLQFHEGGCGTFLSDCTPLFTKGLRVKPITSREQEGSRGDVAAPLEMISFLCPLIHPIPGQEE